MIYNEVMLDLETMGRRTSAPVVAIGAVSFNLKERQTGPTFSAFIDLEDAVRTGAVIEADIVLWWLRQTKEAQDKTFQAVRGHTLNLALGDFSLFCQSLCKKEDLKVWGNSVSFDNAILKESYERVGISTPWEFWNEMCYRTKKQEYPGVRIVREGTKHNAIDDAISQVKHLFAIYDYQSSIKDTQIKKEQNA